MIIYSCLSCINYIGKVKGIKPPTCKAFSEGIPEDILNGKNDHTKKHPKQKNNILFEAVNDKQP